jgi:hypothetical protein
VNTTKSPKKVAILQSNYIPWKGYFDLIASVDEVILFDDMQYTRRDWRNRNQIKTPQGLQWLTVPVLVKGKYFQTIRETAIDGSTWALMHWKALSQNYIKSAYFKEIATWLEPLYVAQSYSHLSQLNRALIEGVCLYLGIQTRITNSWDYQLVDGKTARLASLCLQANATEYVSGPAAQSYIDESVFDQSNIDLTWFEYGSYPEYPQLYGLFQHHVSILDLLFNCGSNSRLFMKMNSADGEQGAS